MSAYGPHEKAIEGESRPVTGLAISIVIPSYPFLEGDLSSQKVISIDKEEVQLANSRIKTHEYPGNHGPHCNQPDPFPMEEKDIEVVASPCQIQVVNKREGISENKREIHAISSDASCEISQSCC